MTCADADFEFDADMILQVAKEEGLERGFYIDDFQYRGFWSQGDGASWRGHVQVQEYIDWKLGQGGINGIPDVTAEIMFWLFNAGVFKARLKVDTRGYYCHEGTMQIEDFSWTFEAPEENAPLGQWGGPFSDTPINDLLKVTNWSWENESSPDDYYNRLWAIMLNDVRDYAKEVYHKLKEAYEAALQEAAE